MTNSNESPKNNKPESSKMKGKMEDDGVAESESETETESDSETETETESDSDSVKGQVILGDQKMLGDIGGGPGGSSASSMSPMSTVARQRGWTVVIGSSSEGASGSRVRKRGDLDMPSGEPVCYVCKKEYGSWKAVFGHLRAHQRETPGAFPPPAFTPPKGSPERDNIDVEALKSQLAPTLLNLARETLQKMNNDPNNTGVVAAGAGDASSSRSSGGPGRGIGPGLGLDFDLNEPRASVLLDLDLNEPASAPAPKKDNDDDKDNNVGKN